MERLQSPTHNTVWGRVVTRARGPCGSHLRASPERLDQLSFMGIESGGKRVRGARRVALHLKKSARRAPAPPADQSSARIFCQSRPSPLAGIQTLLWAAQC